MYIGIDVGGTFTDGVLIENNRVLKDFKVNTNKDNLLESITQTLDKLLDDVNKDNVQRIVVSTTLMTNLILENKYDPTGLLFLAGSSINISELTIPFAYKIASGNIDFQGRILEDIDENEIIRCVKELIKEKYIINLGIISKFSTRNPDLELKAKKIIKEHFPKLNILSSHEVSGQLNFKRRAMNLGLTLASGELFTTFTTSLQEALKLRNLKCPGYILKADGGVVPINSAHKFAVDTIFSGPAASCFGAKALLGEDSTAVVIDIGGTTTDLSLVLDAIPLYASKGAKINNIYTHVRSLAVNSLPIGGDTSIILKGNEVSLSFKKEGIPACLGGNNPTVTDCLRVLNLSDFGDKDKAESSLDKLAKEVNLTSAQLAQKAMDLVVSLIQDGIELMYISWQNEPRYRIWQLLHTNNNRLNNIIALGGPSAPIGKLISRRMRLNNIYYPVCNVANAIGAALALPNYEENIRINTTKKEISTSWGYFSKQNMPQRLSKEDAINLSKQIFREYLSEFNIKESPEIYQYEVFNMIRNMHTSGQIHEIKIGITPQIIGNINLRRYPHE
ncbi:Hydantoinase/oxoprolinase N-terminal region [Desulfonispora thiosulfatigenes DSM 11270]|uniref:Hydantoinase/oxoprolinase N-terminal region n=1 Tax=Desulfonispora thiosulfatigenes DSM 11270 TaxID=656914 RepID=A0A1W1VP33_DESTI|nr:hydantoinase/oxoprolinase family protein [Desulfonispora thiosulfatigenes]SMB95086.1 Hydantoinase/oxoprolinase N-terminal region [Desulfonispora thiosulfatigenes DSM 11270]